MSNTVQAIWTAARERLKQVSSSASLDAQVLLADVLNAADRAYLFAHPERVLTEEETERYQQLITRRVRGEPVAYIRGFKDWFDRQIIVTPDVLIPRPETELLLESALDFARTKPTLTAVDVCTGSGAIAVTLAAHAPNAVVHATDISPAALAVAQQNAKAADTHVIFHEGDLLMPLIRADVQVDLLIANPPYIDHEELQTLDVSRHEPHLALDGGAGGMAIIRRLLQDIRRVCRPGARVLVEIGADQGAETRQLASAHLTATHIEIVKDYAGHDRFLKVDLT